MKIFITLLISSIALSTIAAATPTPIIHHPNLEKEALLVEAIEETIMTGDTLYLHDGEREFLTIFTEASIPTKSTIILIHGMGSNANTTQVIHPLRTALAKNYNTISIQMPVLKAGMVSDDYRPIIFPISKNRIHAVINHLQDEGLSPDFIIGHSIGAAMGANYLSQTITDFSGFIAIGMPQCSTLFLPKIDIPVLDLFGTNDIPSVISGIIPKMNASAHNTFYSQKQVETNHNFDNEDQMLIYVISNWLELQQQ